MGSRKARPLNVVIVSVKDNAGSGARFAQALRSAGHKATMCAYHRNKYGYPIDQLLPLDHEPQAIRSLLRSADLVHFKGDELPSITKYPHFGTGTLPRVLTVSGSGFRRKDLSFPIAARKLLALEWHRFDRYYDSAHAFSAITPDLLYSELPMRWIPHAFPKETPVTFREVEELAEPIIIGHSPSRRVKKGTGIFLQAVQILRQAGYYVRTDIMEGLSNAECIERKGRCHLFFDQGIVPAYGMSAVEAMMMGVPVVTRLTDAVRARDPRLHRDVCPVIGFESVDPFDAAQAMQRAIDAGLPELSSHTRAYAERVHSFEAAAANLVDFYRSVLR